MAWPPPTLPINFTDATAQGPGVHPNAHNALSQAINDTVAEMGPNPSGTYATVDARLAADAAHLVQNNGSGWLDQLGGVMVISNIRTGITTDQYGNFMLTFPYTFKAVPACWVWSAINPPGTYTRIYVHQTSTVSATYWLVGNSSTGGGMANANIEVGYCAIGPK